MCHLCSCLYCGKTKILLGVVALDFKQRLNLSRGRLISIAWCTEFQDNQDCMEERKKRLIVGSPCRPHVVFSSAVKGVTVPRSYIVF